MVYSLRKEAEVITVLYFRDDEKNRLRIFCERENTKAMAIYGRRRTGKTALMLDFLAGDGKDRTIYYQCTSFDYRTCLADFTAVLTTALGENGVLRSLDSFRDVFSYLCDTGKAAGKIIVIDEFPFLAKKDENVVVEFQWIIDHALKGMKLVLLGSSLSFMKKQLNDSESPLYGRFDEILRIRPFSFSEVQSLFPVFEDAVNVYAQTGGVAQYVMFFLNYSSVKEATGELFLDRNGRLLQEAPNLLMQELREITTYTTILRSIGSGEKDTGKLAAKCGMDIRNIFAYLRKLADLEIVSAVENPLSGRKTGQRYRISDSFFRFHYAFIEPNISMITELGKNAEPYVLNEQYSEFLGFVYEDIVRSACFEYARKGMFPFMPRTVAKWWGNIQEDGTRHESEIDVIAYDDHQIILGECKYRSKAVGLAELDSLKKKSSFIPVKDRKVYYLLASKSGFTRDLEALEDDRLLLLKNA